MFYFLQVFSCSMLFNFAPPNIVKLSFFNRLRDIPISSLAISAPAHDLQQPLLDKCSRFLSDHDAFKLVQLSAMVLFYFPFFRTFDNTSVGSRLMFIRTARLLSLCVVFPFPDNGEYAHAPGLSRALNVSASFRPGAFDRQASDTFPLKSFAPWRPPFLGPILVILHYRRPCGPRPNPSPFSSFNV